MRSLVIAVTLLVTSIAHAAPELQFFTERASLYAGQQASVFVGNSSEETARDVVVHLEWSEGLTLYNGVQTTLFIWNCTVAERSATCSTPELEPGVFDGVFFTFLPTDQAGGHRAATATLSAREVGTVNTITFDILTAHTATITSTADSGAGSLREAIEEMNANPLCGTEIPCSIALGDWNREPITIAPLTPLPAIRKCNLSITAPDQGEFPLAEKRAAISGENASYGNGLEIRAACPAGVPGVSIASLAVHSWPWNGIHFEAPAPHAKSFVHTLSQVYVGTDRTGLVAKPNRSRGINIDSPHEDVIIYNGIASGNGRTGIAAWRGKHVYVSGMKIGVDRNGNPLGNGASGFFSQGVPFQLVQNTIAYNAHFGVALTPVTGGEAQVTHNAIHSNAGLPIDWNLDGRTLPDDETDGILNAPQILDAFYDDASQTTTIRGVVRLRAGAFGGSFGLYLYRASSTRGDVTEMLPIPPQGVAAPAEGVEDVPFEIEIAGVPRGTLIAAQTVAGTVSPETSSEISEALAVR